MRYKTFVYAPLAAVLATLVVSLPASQSEASANAPQTVRATPSPTPTQTITRTERASRSASRYKYASPKYNKKFAQVYMLSKYNWKRNQYICLVNLWNRESGWKVTADNPNSSAYGIPQALPGSKMGTGWKTDPHVQIKWGLRYIEQRYNTPCGAWSAFKKKGWY